MGNDETTPSKVGTGEGFIVLGAELAAARDQEKRHRREHVGPSPLRGISPYPREAHVLFRFQELPTDMQIDVWLTAARDLDTDERAALRDALTMDDQYVLNAYVHRLVIRSLRARSTSRAVLGAEAIGLMDAERMDWRDTSVATMLIAHVLTELGADPEAVFGEVAQRSAPAAAEWLRAFDSDELEAIDEATGYLPVEGPDGLILLSTEFDEYEPTVDLVSLALLVADVIDADPAWVTTDIAVASTMPGVWFSDPGTISEAMRRGHGGIMVRGEETSGRSPQMLLANVFEAASETDAAIIADGIGSGRSAALGMQEGPIAIVMISRSTKTDVSDKETDASLARFAAPLRAASSGWTRQGS